MLMFTFITLILITVTMILKIWLRFMLGVTAKFIEFGKSERLKANNVGLMLVAIM